MNKVFHPADSRGFADHGWLKAQHSFSFAGWYNPERINFGKLRVLNDDIIAPGEGFGTHPHENMEIISIPLEGELAHKDNTGHQGVIKHNEIQVMSAGTGIYHSEFNASNTKKVNLLQLWIFPDRNGHEPRYDQKSFDPSDRKNKLHTFISPDKSENNLWLNQNAYFSWCDLDENNAISYKLNSPSNGVYIFIIGGIVKIDNQILSMRDAIGIWNFEEIKIYSEKDSNILFVEVPID